MGKVVATLVVVTVLGVAVVFFVAGGRPMNEPQAHELTDEEKQEHHRYLMSSDCGMDLSLGDPCAQWERTEVLKIRIEQERRRAAEAEAELARLKAEVARMDAEKERLRQSKRRARTKSKSTQRQAEAPMPRGIHSDDPLGDLVPSL